MKIYEGELTEVIVNGDPVHFSEINDSDKCPRAWYSRALADPPASPKPATYVAVDPGPDRARIGVQLSDGRVVRIPLGCKLCLPHGGGEPYFTTPTGRHVPLDGWKARQEFKGRFAAARMKGLSAHEERQEALEKTRRALAASVAMAVEPEAKSDGQLAHETMHAELAKRGVGQQPGGYWAGMKPERKEAWEAAAKAVRDRA